MRKLIILALCIFAFGLYGCGSMNMGVSAANNYIAANSSATVANVHQANLQAAELWGKIGCGMTYDAVVNSDEKTSAAIIALCGAPKGFLLVKSTGTTVSIQQPTAAQ